MPRKKPAPPAAAMQNALIAATIAELPAPSRGGFPADAREAWISMIRGALDVVYGPLDRAPPRAPGLAAVGKRYTVSPNGRVMCDGLPVKWFAPFPAGTVLWDERTKPDHGFDGNLDPAFGLTDNIEWADVGCHPQGELPPGVMMRPASGIALGTAGEAGSNDSGVMS